MTFRRMEYLLAVAQDRSFTRAAERLNVTQAGLSQQIKALERSVGASLLDRSAAGGARLTAAGREYARHADVAVQAERRAVEAVADHVAGRAGELHVATVMSMSADLLPPSIALLHRTAPDIRVRLSEYQHREELEQAVLHGRADLGVGPTPASWHGTSSVLGVERFVLVLPRGHPAAPHVQPYEDRRPPSGAPMSAGRLPVGTLTGHPWVLFNVEHGLNDLVEQHLRAARLRPAAALRTGQVEAAVRLAAAGTGVCLVPASSVPAHGFDAVVCEPSPSLTREVSAFACSGVDGLALRYVTALTKCTGILETSRQS